MNNKETEEWMLKNLPEEMYFDLRLIESYSDKIRNPNLFLEYMYMILDSPKKRTIYFLYRKIFSW